jgi:hypothetical protein
MNVCYHYLGNISISHVLVQNIRYRYTQNCNFTCLYCYGTWFLIFPKREKVTCGCRKLHIEKLQKFYWLQNNLRSNADDEMDGSCSMYGRGGNCLQTLSWKAWSEETTWENVHRGKIQWIWLRFSWIPVNWLGQRDTGHLCDLTSCALGVKAQWTRE